MKTLADGKVKWIILKNEVVFEKIKEILQINVSDKNVIVA